MAPRRRKEINRPLRPGMRVREGYYSWTNPQSGVEYGLGRDRQKAINEVIAAEVHIASKRTSLLERISGGAMSWSDWCDQFEKILAARETKPNTKRTLKSQMARLRRSFPVNAAAARVTTQDCSAVIDAIVAEDKQRTAHAFRSFLIDCFDRMIAKGIRKDNPARVLDEVKVKVKRSRLSFDVFMRLYSTTSNVRLRNAMALAIVSGQARESITGARFADFKPDGWWSERGKTGARIIIPLELRLERFGMSLDEVVKQCRSTGVLSQHLIHQTEQGAWKRPGAKTHVDQLTREFTEELAKLGLKFEGNAPTFHEIRSLAGRMYREQGNVSPQELLGHTDARTTAIYTDGRGEWVKVGVR
jgi:enterobacteria phage integrase